MFETPVLRAENSDIDFVKNHRYILFLVTIFPIYSIFSKRQKLKVVKTRLLKPVPP